MIFLRSPQTDSKLLIHLTTNTPPRIPSDFIKNGLQIYNCIK